MAIKLTRSKNLKKSTISENALERARTHFHKSDVYPSGFVALSQYRIAKTADKKNDMIFLENPETGDGIIHVFNEEKKIIRSMSNKPQLLKY